MSGTPGDESGAVYRWHQLVWRVDDLDRQSANGLPVDEVTAFDAEREALRAEIARLEEALGPERSARMRRSHAADRAYRRQLEEMDAEDAEDGGGRR